MKRLILVCLALVCATLIGSAPRAQTILARPLTGYTLYATGTSTTSPVSIGQRSGISASNGGYGLIRLVGTLSFYFNFDASNVAGISASLSTYFLPANEVGWFYVPWGNWLAVILPHVVSGIGDSVAQGRSIIHVMEAE